MNKASNVKCFRINEFKVQGCLVLRVQSSKVFNASRFNASRFRAALFMLRVSMLHVS